jgi:hypothetical protein
LTLLAVTITAAFSSVLSAEVSAKEDTSAGGPTIVRVFTGWRDAASFKHISEYFTGRENTGRETVLRTNPEQRTGFYFQVRVANPGAARPVRFQLLLIEPGSPTPHATSFPADLPSGSTVFQLGLTGPAWQDAKSLPVAWQVQVLAEDGRVLAFEKSYLWEKPAAN